MASKLEKVSYNMASKQEKVSYVMDSHQNTEVIASKHENTRSYETTMKVLKVS
jgi:S-adenosylhomocysteine hydrolase